jgi:mRNA-degrading endonuclease RelE of RelBE toxin-antitoxin system
MNFKVESTPNFLSEAKKLSKKYASLKSDLIGLESLLKSNPTMGTPLGGGVYKIRLAIQSKGKGKSGGARVITCVKIIGKTIYLVSIYDKSVQSTMTDKEIKTRIKQLPE